MHMMSKKRIKLRRGGHSKKVQNLTVVLTAIGEVHTHEEAQVFVNGPSSASQDEDSEDMDFSAPPEGSENRRLVHISHKWRKRVRAVS